MAYEPTLDDVLNSLYGPEGGLTEEELAQYMPEPYVAPEYAPSQFANTPGFKPHIVGAGLSKSPISKVDPRLQEILSVAAQNSPFDVQFKSGYREGDKRQHGKHNAIDVQLVDKRTGKALADYQDPRHFRDYEQFAQTAKAVQEQMYPELADAFRWGGYFSGKKNYGALDLMHFDIGGGNGLGMAGGSWEGGLNEKQRSLWQGVQSQGMGQRQPAYRAEPQQFQQKFQPEYGAGISQDILAAQDAQHGFPPGTMHRLMMGESQGRTLGYHYKDGAKNPQHSDFGFFGIKKDYTGVDPGYGVSPLANTSPEEQARFAADYLGEMTRRTGSLNKGIAAYHTGLGNWDSEDGRKYVNWVQGQPGPKGGAQQPQETPFDIVKLSDGTSVDVAKGSSLADLAAALKANGIDAEPLKQVALPDGSYVDAPFSYADEQVLEGMRKQMPEVFGEQPEEASNRGYGAAAKSSFEAGIGSALTGLGGLGTYAGEKLESPLARQAGEYLTGKGKEWQKMGEEAYQELTPEEAKAMGFGGQFRKYVGEPVAGFVGSMGAALPALALPGGAATRVGAFAAQELGGQLEEQERMGQAPDVEKALPYAVGSGIVQNSLLGPLKYVTKAFGKPDVLAKIAEITEKEGADAAKQYAGGMMKNILAETGVNTGEVVISEVISRAAERAASGQPLDTPDALAEYEDIAIKSAPGGLLGIPGAFGVHAAKQGTIEEAQLAKRQEDQAARIAAERQDVEEVAAAVEVQKQAEADAELERQAGIGVPEPTIRGQENVAPTEPPLAVEEQPAPVAPVSANPPVAPEISPEAVQAESEVAEEIPEPTIRGKEPKLPEAVAPEVTNPADILGLNNRSGLRKQLQGFDINNVEDHPKIEGILQKTSATFSAENLANLENKMKEVQSANGIQKPAEIDAGSFEQPEIRQEGRDQTISSEGVRSSGQEIGTVKIPEAETIAPIEQKVPSVPEEGKAPVSVVKLPPPAEAWDSLRTPEQPAFESLSKDTQKLWKDEYKASEGIVDKSAVDELTKSEKLFTKEAKTSNPDVGIRPIKVEDYSDVKNTRELAKRYKEKGTDPELLKLMDTINVSPHLGALPVEWVQKGDKPHPDVVDAFNKGATAMVAWGAKTGPKMYIRADAPQREDVLVHEAVHGVTEAALQRNPESAKELSDLSKQIGYSLSEEHRMAHGSIGKEASDFWNEVIKDNPGELLAYGLTSPTFREVLSQYGADGKPFKAYRTEAELNAIRKGQERPERVFKGQAPKELTLWDKFVDAVARLFGLPTSRKAEFKRQLDEYLNKKSTYEQKVKDYNTLRPLQERLDTAFKEALKETSKKGIDFEGTAVKQVKEEAERTAPLVKETEAESSLKRGVKEAINAFKGNTWTKLETKYVNKDAAMRAVIKDLPLMTEDGKLRADMQASARDQIFNVISAGATDGIPVYSNAGTVMIQKNAKYSPDSITKSIDKVKEKDPRPYVGFIFRALRGEELKKEDAEAIKQIDILEDKAKKLKALAKTQSFAEGKKADTLANRYLAEAKKLKDRVGEEGREKLVTDEDILEAKRRLAKHPEIQEILDNVRGLMHSLVDLAVESGWVSKEVGKEWKSRPYYFPLYMSQEDILNDPSKVVRAMGGGAKSLPNVKALKGGTHAINMLENLYKHYAFMISASAQNSTRKAAARDLELFGAAERTSPDDKNAIMFKEDGKEIYYKIADPLMFEAFQAAAPLTNPLLKAAREYTKAFRAVTLVNPLYWYRQLIRDPIHANVVSQTGMVTPIGATISFAKIIAGASPEYAELRRRGVVGAVDSLSDPARFKKIYDKGPNLFKKGADWVMHVHEAADAATRVEVYKAATKEAKKRGMSKEQAKDYATMRAREIINFANQGRSETLQAIRSTVPFFSAALNSLDSVVRAATGKGLNRREAAEARRLFTSRMLMIASFTTAYALAMQDDEDYLKSPDSINNWLIPTGNKENPFIMIPLPFELGFIAKVIPELIVRLNSGTLTAYEGKKALKEAAGATLTPPLPFPQVIKPLVEAAINYDLHQGRPIVSPSEAGKLPEEQTKGASALSIEMGRQLGLSPAQIEHFGRGYLTELWTAIGVLSDAFLPAGQSKEAKGIAEIPTILGGAKGILSKPDRDRDMDIFYELSNGAQQIKRSMSAAQGKGDVDAMERIMADPEKKKRFYASDVGRNIGDEISKVNTSIEQIRNDKSITDPKKKQEMIREKQQYKNQLATQGKEWFYSLGANEP